LAIIGFQLAINAIIANQSHPKEQESKLSNLRAALKNEFALMMLGQASRLYSSN